MALGEFQLIDRFFRRRPRRDDVLAVVGDDCALLRPAPGQVLAVSIDTLNESVHFPAGTDPAAVGHKALAVGLSDLAAAAAEPAWATLSLSLPAVDEAWVAAFTGGFLALCGRYGVDLVGGDTVRGPLSVTVQVHGLVPAAHSLRRGGARAGDLVCVSGALGGAALALRQWAAGEPVDAAARLRLDRPQPRVATGLALRGLAHAGIDVSDGLLADLDHILEASGVGADLDAAAIPLDPALAALDPDPALRLALSGGDDYELCFTLPPAARSRLEPLAAAGGCPITVIGRISAQPGLRLRQPDGRLLEPGRVGHDHFGGGA